VKAGSVALGSLIVAFFFVNFGLAAVNASVPYVNLPWGMGRSATSSGQGVLFLITNEAGKPLPVGAPSIPLSDLQNPDSLFWNPPLRDNAKEASDKQKSSWEKYKEYFKEFYEGSAFGTPKGLATDIFGLPEKRAIVESKFGIHSKDDLLKVFQTDAKKSQEICVATRSGYYITDKGTFASATGSPNVLGFKPFSDFWIKEFASGAAAPLMDGMAPETIVKSLRDKGYTDDFIRGALALSLAASGTSQPIDQGGLNLDPAFWWGDPKKDKFGQVSQEMPLTIRIWEGTFVIVTEEMCARAPGGKITLPDGTQLGPGHVIGGMWSEAVLKANNLDVGIFKGGRQWQVDIHGNYMAGLESQATSYVKHSNVKAVVLDAVNYATPYGHSGKLPARTFDDVPGWKQAYDLYQQKYPDASDYQLCRMADMNIAQQTIRDLIKNYDKWCDSKGLAYAKPNAAPIANSPELQKLGVNPSTMAAPSPDAIFWELFCSDLTNDPLLQKVFIENPVMNMKLSDTESKKYAESLKVKLAEKAKQFLESNPVVTSYDLKVYGAIIRAAGGSENLAFAAKIEKQYRDKIWEENKDWLLDYQTQAPDVLEGTLGPSAAKTIKDAFAAAGMKYDKVNRVWVRDDKDIPGGDTGAYESSAHQDFAYGFSFLRALASSVVQTAQNYPNIVVPPSQINLEAWLKLPDQIVYGLKVISPALSSQRIAVKNPYYVLALLTPNYSKVRAIAYSALGSDTVLYTSVSVDRAWWIALTVGCLLIVAPMLVSKKDMKKLARTMR
jgi:predicted house-cleaning noncanonical NTP pyrophosphatase (MazG superfamily)